MKASYIDHLKSKFRPTFFGLFETQKDSLLKNVYAYIYNETVRSSPAITECRGPVAGGHNKVTISEIRGEFDAYGHNPKLQAEILARVNQYVADFEEATILKPTPEQTERLLEVRDYFQTHIKTPIGESTRYGALCIPK